MLRLANPVHRAVVKARGALKKGWADLPVQNFTINDDFHVLRSRNGLSQDYHGLADLADNPGTRTSSAGSYWMLRSFAGRSANVLTTWMSGALG